MLQWEICSGAAQSFSTAARNGFANITTMTLDIDDNTDPDVHADWSHFNPWRRKLRWPAYKVGNHRLRVEDHLHISNDCGSRCMRSRHLHRKKDSGYMQPRTDRAKCADGCAEATAFYIQQHVREKRLTTTFTIEQPSPGDMFRMKSYMQLTCSTKTSPAALKKVCIDYCAYGGSGKKPTQILCSSVLPTDWAKRCRRMRGNHKEVTPVGGCGAITGCRGSKKHVGRRCGHSAKDGKLPLLLTLEIINEWRSHHAAAKKAMQDKGKKTYGSITKRLAQKLANEWDTWAKNRRPLPEDERALPEDERKKRV